MKYGYFDDIKREYVITKPNTPAPWANYLGSPEYGAIISNNAGGYSFVKSGANGRILRYIFNDFDQPGRYMYIRDNESRDYWSASWQPVGKDLQSYKSQCFHGTGYTRMEADYSEIHSEALYYVPMDCSYEVWNLKLTNYSEKTRELTITGYVEFTNNSNYEQDQVNLQYSKFISRTKFSENRISQLIHGNLDGLEEGKDVDDKIVTERFFGLAGSQVSSYCGEKEKFLGNYHNYSNPVGVENGDLGGATNYNGNACGALSTIITLQPGETKEIAFILGMKYENEAREILALYEDVQSKCEKELNQLITYWHEKLSHFQVKTPSPEFNTMINTWNAYNCFMTFIWSRAASFIYCGLRNGYGYRDTVQDIQGIIHLAPEMAVEKIRFMLSAQVHHGGGLPLVKFTHNPGHEDTPEDASYVKETGHPAYRADDALWLFPTVYKYITETGNIAFLDEVIPYANKDEGTVYDHLKRAIDFSMNHLGRHGMPAGLHADWNDCLRLGAQGESSFVALQFYYGMTILKKFAEYKNDTEYIAYLEKSQEELAQNIEEFCWNQDRFIRGFTEEGEVIGHRDDPEANMWLNPQSWSVISGYASKEQAELALENVYSRLNTEYGAILMDPPYHEHAFEGALAVIYNAGTKENAGIFSQSQGWIILAEALCGHGDRAFQYFMENAPAAQNDRKVINIYSWNDEARERICAVYDRVVETNEAGTITTLDDGTEIHWIVNPNQDGVYQQKLDEALLNQASAAADDKVDIFLSETDYVYKYTDADADVAIPLKDLGIDPATDLSEQYDFTKVTASDANGVQRGSTWQCCPGLLVYRRDIAKDAFGTDDPQEIAKLTSDWETMKTTAQTLKDKGYYTFASYADTFRLFGNSIKESWVKSGDTKVVVDEQIMNWVNLSKEWLDAGYLNETVKGQWNDDWNKSMGSESKVFAFLLPAWGIDFVLNPNWDGEMGTWAVTTPPQEYNWGGSYIHACAGTDNPVHAKEIILALTADQKNLLMISETYADFTNTQSGMQKAATDAAFASEFLGGQNPIEYFAPVAEKIQMAPLSSYDQGCVELIQNSFSDYLQGQVDFDKAKTNFEMAIKERYPDVTEVVWPQ